MKPFKIGIWIDQSDLPEAGGGFSYTQRLIDALNLRIFSNHLEIYFIGFNLKSNYNKPTINLPFTENVWIRKKALLLSRFLHIKVERTDLKQNYVNAINTLKENEIQLIFYPNPIVHLENYPYILVNWDLGHKSTYSFPELTMDGQYSFRVRYNETILNEAIFICCESEEGKLEIVKYHNINPDRLKIFPMFPGGIIENRFIPKKPLWLDDYRFFIYPAQFWAHKNHYNLLVAFSNFIKLNSNSEFKLILTGSDKGNLAYIKDTIKELSLSDNVIVSGFIEIEELKWLYENTVGLIFPSFLGPTNMPLLEAKSLGCNIACSNLKGHKELLSNDAIFFDPKDIHQIAEAFTLLAKTKKPEKKESETSLHKELDVLEKIFSESITIRKTWGNR